MIHTGLKYFCILPNFAKICATPNEFLPDMSVSPMIFRKVCGRLYYQFWHQFLHAHLVEISPIHNYDRLLILRTLKMWKVVSPVIKFMYIIWCKKSTTWCMRMWQLWLDHYWIIIPVHFWYYMYHHKCGEWTLTGFLEITEMELGLVQSLIGSLNFCNGAQGAQGAQHRLPPLLAEKYRYHYITPPPSPPPLLVSHII